MSSEDKQKRLNENYRLIPMKDITDEARDIAVMWVEGYKPAGIINLEQKHKLASDIMNYAALHAKDFADWLAEMTEVIRDENITLYRYYHIGDGRHGNYTRDDIYLEYLEHLKRTP